MWRPLIVAVLALSACATFQPVTEGQTSAFSWYAADMRRSGGRYLFSLVLTETQGTAITLNEVKTTVYQPGTGPGSAVYRGTWELPANGAIRIALRSGLYCVGGNCVGPNNPVPLWQFVLSGQTASGAPVRTVIDLRLPPDPPVPPRVTADSIPEINLTPPRPPAATNVPPGGKQ